MKPSTLIRVASILTLIYGGGHTAGAPWTPTKEPAAVSLVTAMKSHPFLVQGAARTYWDFYFGFGLTITVFFVIQAITLWQIGTLAKIDARRLRPIIATFFFAFVVNAIIAWKYFFIVPVILALLILIVLGLAFVAASRDSPE